MPPSLLFVRFTCPSCIISSVIFVINIIQAVDDPFVDEKYIVDMLKYDSLLCILGSCWYDGRGPGKYDDHDDDDGDDDDDEDGGVNDDDEWW